MHLKWNYVPPTSNETLAAEELGSAIGKSPVIGRMLIKRGVTTPEAARRFFRPQLTDLHDPFLMKDMDVAVDRLNAALGRKERILVYGDYDVDGCTAVALVYKFLLQFYSNIDYYVPDRYEEGYGVSDKALEYAQETSVKLIIILDCGIKANKQIARAKELGIDFIICDHHVPDEELPDAVAILNPKRKDNTYPFEHLCGCGVGFKLMQGFAKSNGIPFSKLIPLLDFCALSIVTDIVPIVEENRILAYHGLRQLNNNPSTGLKAIIEICGLKDRELNIGDITFRIGPRINASGRVQSARQTIDLLIERNFDKALEMANNVNEYNEQRRDIDKQMTEEANEIVARLSDKYHDNLNSLVLYEENWTKGVVGIVASRLSEIYMRPTIVFTSDGEYATGSARSVSGFDIYKAIESCRDLLENFGGHIYAAGLTVKLENFQEFRHRFCAYVDEHLLPEQKEAILDIEAMIDFKDITGKLRSDIKRFEPFGPMNEKPNFCTCHVFDYGTSKVVGREQEHIKLELIDSKSSNVMNGIAFGQSQQARYIKSKSSFDIVYTIEENTYKRNETQLQIIDIRPSEKE
ncbi:MAG: single-stranded-DNA-specific exonuclease RecJ [Bacteroidaceae bacterium]|nr:single-stranded-DNA-specific exonuclease RecJ [Bacteroidaceae bacterium]